MRIVRSKQLLWFSASSLPYSTNPPAPPPPLPILLVHRTSSRPFSPSFVTPSIGLHSRSAPPSPLDDGRIALAASYDAVSEDLCLRLLPQCNSRALKQGICVHSPIIKLGLLGHLPLTNRILSFYSKHGDADQALKLFEELHQRDVVSWTSVISTYARRGFHDKALHMFDQMLSCGGASPNQFTLSIVLRCASSVGDFYLGLSAHARILKQGYDSGTVIGSALVDHYSKCGDGGGLEEAWRVFEAMDCRDTVAWTTMISAAVQAEDQVWALRLYASMLESRVSPNEFTFTKLLAACSGSLPLPQRRCEELVHAHLILWGAQLNLILKTALVDMYSKRCRMKDAVKILHLTQEYDVTLWTAMVSGYTHARDYEEAMATLSKMETAGVFPNSFTYAGILHACSCLEARLPGMQIHSRVVKSGLEHDASVGNALVDMYSKVSLGIGDPLRAFRSISSPNVVSWTALIAGLVHHGQVREALVVFSEMQIAGKLPNSFTLSAILRGCGELPYHSVASARACRLLHGYVLKTGWSDTWDVTVENSLVDAYARSGRAGDAWNVFRRMPPGRRDVVTYTSLARGLNEMGLHHQALAMLTPMGDEGVRMDGFSLACFLSSAAGLVAIETGKLLHCYAVKSGLSSWISVYNGLVDMYGKCGCIDDARAAFTWISEPNVVSWNGLISGLASSGRFSEALSAFEEMRLAGAWPDAITFLLVLNACSHSGMVDLGVEYFESMGESSYGGIVPQPEHYVCLVDMLGRAGRLEAAACAIETMPFQPDALIYKTLLASCKLHGNLVLGECMASRALEMDQLDPAIYVLLAGLYDDAGKLEWGEQIRRMMMERGVRKCPGWSWMKTTSR